MTRRLAPVRAPLACVPLLFASACGGTTPTHRPLAAAERELVAHLPADTWMLARLDARAVRGAPHYDVVQRALERDDPTVASFVQGIDVAYVAVGGFREVPEARDDDEAAVMLANRARALGGKLPHFVVALAGPTADDLCDAVRAQGPGPDVRGFRTGSREELVVAVRRDICLATMTPFLDDTLAAHDGAPALLRGLGPLGDSTLYASAAMVLESDGFRDLVGAIAADAGDRERARIRRTMELVVAGIHDVSGTFSRADAGYRWDGRLVASDAGRGVMWRELTELVLQFVDAALEGVDDDEAAMARRVLEGWEVVESPGGFETHYRLTDEALEPMLRAFEEGAREVTVAAVSAADRPWLSMASSARENLAAYDEYVAEHGAPREDQRVEVTLLRAHSLAQLARYDEARRVLAELLVDLEAEGVADREADRTRTYVAACEVALAAGDRTAATEFAQRADRLGTFVDTMVALDGARCGIRALLAAGERGPAERALADAEARFGTDALGLEVLRAEIELASGRADIALAITRALCTQRSYLGECLDASALACEARLASTPRPDDTATTCRAVLDRSDGAGLREEAAHLRVAVAACEASVARRAVEAPEHCDDAVARLRDAGAGETPLALRLASARADYADMRGDADEARALRAEAERIRGGLPATHPLRVTPPAARVGAGSRANRPAGNRRPSPR